MELAPMRYKNYTWPHNPRVYTIEYKRELGCQKVPFGRYHLQDLGLTRRVMRGEGEFVGPEAYDQFKKLASVFYSEGPGMLIHPVWQLSNAYFAQLSLTQEPRPDYVRYSFTFWESFDGYDTRARTAVPASAPSAGAGGQTQGPGRFHEVRPGESLWGIGVRYGVGLPELVRLNPWLKNPNRLRPGEKVRLA